MAEAEVLQEDQPRIHCANCGAELRYQPGTEVLQCPYCSTENQIDEKTVEIRENHLLSQLDARVKEQGKEEVETLECQSCGAINPFDKELVGQDCMFCGGHLLLKNATLQEKIKPQALVPFQLEKREALQKYHRWIKSLWFAPNKLKEMQNHPNQLKGIYIPYWTFDAHTESDYTGMRGEPHTVMESYTTTVDGKRVTQTRPKTEIRWYPAAGHVSHFFDDVLELGSDSLPRLRAMKLDPWDLSKLVPYNDDYLRGFLVEHYAVELHQAWQQSRKRIQEDIRGLVRQDIGGAQQQIHSLDTDWNQLTFKHILLPVYVSAYRYKGKPYTFLINGQTGEVQGERPWSYAKIAAVIIAVLVVVAVIWFFSEG
jgi:DNA-directed RNA polymerase subunit RPC12/RpoP